PATATPTVPRQNLRFCRRQFRLWRNLKTQRVFSLYQILLGFLRNPRAQNLQGIFFRSREMGFPFAKKAREAANLNL
ncbi:MAG: hypothetical protein SOR74_00090, partial [Candidatus Faecivicinus sp.]|nr:hypothetical protein [Candidatus Faecivicinus sp.]